MDGRYVINIMDHVALNRNDIMLKGMQYKLQNLEKPASLTCGICSKILQNPVNTPCCDKTYCRKCVTSTIFFETKDSFHTCPNCKSIIDSLESFTADQFLKDIIREWNSKKLSEKDIERMLLTRERKVKKKKSSKNDNVVDDDDLTDDIFGLSKKDDQLMLTAENYISMKQEEEQSMTRNYYDMTQPTVAGAYQPISVVDNCGPSMEMNYQTFNYMDNAQRIMICDPTVVGGFTVPYGYDASRDPMIQAQYNQARECLPQISDPHQEAIEMERSRRLRELEDEFLKKTMDKSILPQGKSGIRSNYEVFEPAAHQIIGSRPSYSTIVIRKDKWEEDLYKKESLRKRSRSRSSHYHEKAIVNKSKYIPVDRHRSEYRDGSRTRDRRNRSGSRSACKKDASRSDRRHERDHRAGVSRRRSRSNESHSHKGKVNRDERAEEHNSGRYYRERSHRDYDKKKLSYDDDRCELYGDRERKSDYYDSSKYHRNSHHSRSPEKKSMNRNDDKQGYRF